MSMGERDREILEQIKQQERAERMTPAEAKMDSSGALAALAGSLVGLCRVVALVAVGFSLLQFYVAWTNSYSAPQQTAGATLAIATAIIPFVLVRVLAGFKR